MSRTDNILIVKSLGIDFAKASEGEKLDSETTILSTRLENKASS